MNKWMQVPKTFFIVCLVVCFAGTAKAQLPPLPTFAIDHYKVWDLQTPSPVSIDRLLVDQWGSMGMAHLDRLDYFANPVNKDNEGIIDADKHLAWYHIQRLQKGVPRAVQARNQFNNGAIQNLIVDSHPEYLLVPAGKNVSEEPADFYVCYRVISGYSINASHNLVDQWEASNHGVFLSVWFCNPALKGGGAYVHPDDHLLFYDIDQSPFNVPFTEIDQFGTHPLTAIHPLWLGVPTQKYQYSPVPAVSEWGVAVMTLLVLTAGTVVVMRRRAAATT